MSDSQTVSLDGRQVVLGFSFDDGHPWRDTTQKSFATYHWYKVQAGTPQ